MKVSAHFPVKFEFVRLVSKSLALALAKLVVFIYQMTWVLFKQSQSEPELDYICEVSRFSE